MSGPGILVAVATTVALVACAGPGGEPHPSPWLDDAALSEAGFGRVAFRARDGNDLTARVYRSRSFEPASGPIWFVMHGASRDAERYVHAAAPVAERYGALVIVPHFTTQAYPKSTDYTLGLQLYAEIERLFESVRGSLGGRQPGYYLFGHSAGAQFTHRLLTFLKGAHALGAVAANAGWYTLPTDEDPRFNTMPYGLKGSPVRPSDLDGFFATPFVVLLGERDTTTAEEDALVRGTPEAQAQGTTRLERGRFYFRVAQTQAERRHAAFRWRIAIVPRAAHDAASVIDSAGFFLFAPDAAPCVPGHAADGAALAITEVLADPPPGAAGDANGDGRRDPSEDEFVEIANPGETPVCLSGWTLGDAKDPERHVFPLGRALPPGGTLVVFGGGVPTGPFHGAEVQWATGGLDLSNAGDVLTLRDGSGSIVRSVSWGDCAGSPCAHDHWPAALDIAASLERPPVPGATWGRPVRTGGSPFSPGEIAGEARR